jgi:hypothetical protein
MISIDISKYVIEIKRHAFIRAMTRGVHPDMIEATIKGGKIKKYGKNNIKFIKKYKRFTVICVDEIAGDKIKIVTIEIR